MPVYNAVLHFLLKRRTCICIALPQLQRRNLREWRRSLYHARITDETEGRPFFRVRCISVSFMQVDSSFARASIFIQLSNWRRCIRNILFKIYRIGMLKLMRKRRLLNELKNYK